MQKLSIEILVKEAKAFCEKESKYDNPDLFWLFKKPEERPDC